MIYIILRLQKSSAEREEESEKEEERRSNSLKVVITFFYMIKFLHYYMITISQPFVGRQQRTQPQPCPVRCARW